jgi:hypothetical protein
MLESFVIPLCLWVISGQKCRSTHLAWSAAVCTQSRLVSNWLTSVSAHDVSHKLSLWIWLRTLDMIFSKEDQPDPLGFQGRAGSGLVTKNLKRCCAYRKTYNVTSWSTVSRLGRLHLEKMLGSYPYVLVRRLFLHSLLNLRQAWSPHRLVIRVNQPLNLRLVHVEWSGHSLQTCWILE